MVKKEVRDAMVKEGKERHKGQLFLAEYSFADRSENCVDLCFCYREPTGAELQAYSEMQSKDSIEANRWLMRQLIISTANGDDVFQLVGPHNVAVATFISEYLNPLFGRALETKPIQSL